jgi:hypothetical protein
MSDAPRRFKCVLYDEVDGIISIRGKGNGRASGATSHD